MDDAARPARLALAVAGVALLVAVAVGSVLDARGVPLHVGAPPFFARLAPHLGPGTPLALLVAALVVGCGPPVATRAPWSGAVAATGAAAIAWTGGLALSRGWRTGVAEVLTTPPDYLSEVAGAPGWRVLLATFTDRVPADAPDAWATHVAGHPPGALLVYLGLDRVGLGGGGWAAALSLLSAGVVAVAVGVAVRALAGEAAGRTVLPFAAVFPGAVWMGVSADAVFAAAGAVGLAALAAAATARRRPVGLLLGAAGGGVLGGCLFLSYGLALLGLPALAVVAGRRAWAVLAAAGLAASGVVVAAGWAGFWWWEGLAVLRGRYLDGYGGERPWAYFAWAGLAGLTVVVGPAAVAGVGRLLARPRRTEEAGVRALALGALAAVVVAAASGLSKGETERIWLPFAVWVVAASVALPGGADRGWLAAQAGTGLALEHLLWSPW